MRKMFHVVLLFLSFCVMSCSSTKNSDSVYDKVMEKQYKDKQKELNKDGWKVATTTFTLDAALMRYYRALNESENNKPIVASVEMCKSMNVCKSSALNNAIIEYAQGASSHVRGRITSDMFNNASAPSPEEFDKFYAAYERLVSAEIKGELEFMLDLQKENGSEKSYQAWYIVNEEKAGKARIRAMQRAFEETKIAQEYANQVANFVREGF